MSADRLPSAVEATRFQKQWFRETAERARAGEPIAIVNADAPHEILRALDIPYVVTQWWSSIIAAKRMSAAALERVAARGLPDFSLQYDAIPLGEQDLPEADRPWGGLPQPAFAIAERSGDITQKIFEQWGERDGTETFLLSRTGGDPAPHSWWELVPHRWEEAFGSERLDLLEGEIGELVAWLEERTGRALETAKLERILALGNEQAAWNRRTRDLIASARPTPVAVNDTMPAVMVPQWHRGTEWAVDAAKRLHDDVAARVEAGAGLCDDERVRLMWVGRGLWSDLDMYRRFQSEFGAVFVWSMYLAIAADGYARHGGEPLRQLAARFVGITDQLYMPPWSSEWYVKEALAHGVDGVVHLVADDAAGAGLITEALEAAGVPVLEIRANNADERSAQAARIPERIEEFLRSRLA